MLLSLLVIMVFFQVVTDGTLLQPLNLTNLVLQNSYIVIMALGMLLVIVAGHIDLSVGSVVGFVGGARGRADGPVRASILVPATIVCLIVGGVIGAAQGYFVAYLQDPVLHRHAGRHAGLQGPHPGAAQRPVGRAVPGGVPAPELGLHSRCRSAARASTAPRCSSALAASRRWSISAVRSARQAAAARRRDGALRLLRLSRTRCCAVLIVAFCYLLATYQRPAERARHHGAC